MQIVENTADRVVIAQSNRWSAVAGVAFFTVWTLGVGAFFVAFALFLIAPGFFELHRVMVRVNTSPWVGLPVSLAMLAFGVSLFLRHVRELLSRTERKLVFNLSAGTVTLEERGLMRGTVRSFPLADVALGIMTPNEEGEPDQCLSVTVPPAQPGAPREEVWANSLLRLPAASLAQVVALHDLFELLVAGGTARAAQPPDAEGVQHSLLIENGNRTSPP
ncbi:MAG: hypothetical protein SF172_09425 [Burkholderiales bacterium]|nr:hypothetical protein [Burkholderiales bacterium]